MSLYSRILAKLTEILTRQRAAEQATMSALTDLQAQVAANTTVIGSTLALIQGLKAQLDAAGTDPQALADLSAQLSTSDQALAAAVAANTPAAPPAPPVTG